MEQLWFDGPSRRNVEVCRVIAELQQSNDHTPFTSTAHWSADIILVALA